MSDALKEAPTPFDTIVDLPFTTIHRRASPILRANYD